MKNKSFVIVAHKYLPQPDDELVACLSKQGHKVLHICHSFPDAPDRKSYCRLYKGGKMVKESSGMDFRGSNEIILYAKEFFYTIFFTLRYGLKWDVYIGMDGLCVLFGFVLRPLVSLKKVIYWAIDFVPANRFDSLLKNALYEAVNRLGYVNADEVWDLSPRMIKAREEKWRLKEGDYKKIQVVPYGMWIDRIKAFPYDKTDNSIVFMGHLLEKQGAQLILKAMPKILESFPNLKLKIIGDGSYRSSLEDLTRDLKIQDSVKFLGRIENNEEMEQEIAKSLIGLAPYIKSLDKWTSFADPGKVKTYLACGIPVLLTDLPWNAKEIEEFGCGMIISEDPESISRGIISYLDENTNTKARNKAREYAKRFDYDDIFSHLDI